MNRLFQLCVCFIFSTYSQSIFKKINTAPFCWQVSENVNNQRWKSIRAIACLDAVHATLMTNSLLAWIVRSLCSWKQQGAGKSFTNMWCCTCFQWTVFDLSFSSLCRWGTCVTWWVGGRSWSCCRVKPRSRCSTCMWSSWTRNSPLVSHLLCFSSPVIVSRQALVLI